MVCARICAKSVLPVALRCSVVSSRKSRHLSHTLTFHSIVPRHMSWLCSAARAP
ncbi:hypothetical protein BC826DRAFT_991436 [Russula brevipes]|nr:hypothetical protein BC826DRAFT_991436 [Russula brevipes]